MGLKKGVLLATLAVSLSGCRGRETPADPEVEEATNIVELPTDAEHAQILKPYLERVKRYLPGTSYVSDEHLPSADELAAPPTFEKVESIKIGMPWIMNDENAAWYIAMDKGYFRAVGLDVELMAGGPGRDHLITLLGGVVDIAVINDSTKVPRLIISRTGADVVIVATLLRVSAGIILGLDRSIPKSSRSQRTLTPADFFGSTMGVPLNSEWVAESFKKRYRIPDDEFKIMRVGDSPEALIAGRIDFQPAWISNQPRLLEQAGYFNWIYLRTQDYLWPQYAVTSVVTREVFENRPDLVKRYLWALYKGTLFLLERPEESADISIRYSTQSNFSREQTLRRFELEAPLIVAGSKEDILKVEPHALDIAAANLLLHGLIELPE